MRNAMFVACCAVGLAAAAGAHLPAAGKTDQIADNVPALTAKVQRLTDLEEIRAIPSCYGFGHDLIYRHLQGDHSDAIAALRRCFVDNLTTNVFMFNETTPAPPPLHSIDELIKFVEGFAVLEGYSSARNVPGNVQVEFTGPSSARVQSSTVAPHFLTIGPNSPSTDFIEARYVHNVVRGDDGVWRAVEFDLVIQQVWRGFGTLPPLPGR